MSENVTGRREYQWCVDASTKANAQIEGTPMQLENDEFPLRQRACTTPLVHLPCMRVPLVHPCMRVHEGCTLGAKRVNPFGWHGCGCLGGGAQVDWWWGEWAL